MVPPSEWNPNKFFIYQLEVHIYIGFKTLKVKCIQYGICDQAAFKNARAIFFSKLGGAGNMFRLGSKNSLKGYPIQIWDLKILWGGV